MRNPNFFQLLTLWALSLASVQAVNLNMTALTGRNNVSLIECWQLTTSFQASNVPGIVGIQAMVLPNAASGAYAVMPSGFDSGLHNPLTKQYVWYVSGMASFTLPNGTGETQIQGGRRGLIFSDDTRDISGNGHGTTYPDTSGTVAFTMPVIGNRAPPHTVLHQGACEDEEMDGV